MIATRCIFGSLVFVLAAACASLPAEGPTPTDGITDYVAGMQSEDGFLPMHYDPETGRILLEVTQLDEDFLYLNTLVTGLGSNRVRLDRGEVGAEAVVRFERHGSRLLMVRRNLSFRARTENEALEQSVEESFPHSVLAALPIEARDGDRFLVDATGFFSTDVFDVAGRIQRAGLGSVNLDRDRSVIRPEHTRAFPGNTEIRAALTFTSSDPGWELRRHAPDGRAITMEQHHSLVQLPESPMEPRTADPRAGLFSVSFLDFAQPFDQPYEDRYVARWRLEKQDPGAEISEPVDPIVYYLDPAVPEPYRTAFIEGGEWWNEIFEAAGFRDAFRIEDLPEGADPMDARYSVIHWVHRTTPGPSVGPSFRDPRTGEIIKTVVRMDSYRSLVNYNLYAGMLPALGDDADVSAEDLAMARRRQHSAHEIGHTLGLAHNFIAASQGRSSVMDYPVAMIRLDENGALDLSDAYREGGGAHDTLAIRYAYTPFESPEAEAEGLREMVREALNDGLRFITGGHAGPAGSLPEASQWVEGSNMIDELENAMQVRSLLLAEFDERAVRPDEPMAQLGARLAPVYLYHRYALQGAIKTVGGMDFTYALRGDGQAPTRIIDPAEQRRALGRVLAALEPDALAIPDRVTELIPPPPFGYGSDLWGFDSPAGSALDPLAMAGTLSAEIVDGLLHRERAARLVSFHARDAANPSLEEVISALLDATWGSGAAADGDAALQRVARRAVLDRLLDLAADANATADVRASAEHHLAELAAGLGSGGPGSPEAAAHRAMAHRDIVRFLERRDDPTPRSEPVPIPLPWP